MIIHEGTAEDIHNWFVTESTDEKVLIIFLGTEPEHERVISDLINQVANVDAVIGREIGFLLCGKPRKSSSVLNRGYGELHLIGAEYIPSRGNSYSARKFLTVIDEQEIHSQEASKTLARSTINIVPNFMELYGIGRAQVPCIVCLFKGMSDYSVLELPNEVQTEGILEWLNSVAEICENIKRDILFSDISQWDLSNRLRNAQTINIEREAKIRKIKQAVLGASSRNLIDQDEAFQIVSLLSSEELDASQKSEVIEKILTKHPEAAKDGRWVKVINLQSRVDELNLLDVKNLDPNGFANLKEKLKKEILKIERISEQISKLKFQELRGKHGQRQAVVRRGNDWERIKNVNTGVSMLEKLYKALRYVTRLYSGGL